MGKSQMHLVKIQSSQFLLLLFTDLISPYSIWCSLATKLNHLPHLWIDC